MISHGLLTPVDTAAALSLWNAAAEHDPLTKATFDEKVFGDPSVPEVLRVAAYSDGTLVGFAIGSYRSTAPVTGCLKMFAVHQQHVRRGIGTQLVELVSSSLTTRGFTKLRVGECPPNYLQPGIDTRYTSAIEFAKSHGFQAFAETNNMSVDLLQANLESSGEMETIADRGYLIRRALPSDQMAVQIFIGENFAAWSDEVDRTFQNNPVSLHIATTSASGEPRVIGFSAYDSNNIGTGWFGPMGTLQDARGTGIGTELLKRCLQDLRDQGLNESVIPWVGPIKFYEKAVGAVVSRTFLRMERVLG